MRLARNYPRLEAAGNAQRVADLPLRKALALLNSPRPKAEAVTTETEATGSPGPPWLPAPGWAVIGHVIRPFDVIWDAYIIPSDVESPEDAWWFVTVVYSDNPNGGSAAEGTKRAIRREFISHMLSSFRFPIEEAEWCTWACGAADPSLGLQFDRRWAFNHVLFQDHDDYVRRAVLR